MSVRTTADENLDDAKGFIRSAEKALAEIVEEQCWGHDEFKPGYRHLIEEVFLELGRMRRKLRDGVD